ncbi:hypothetical protein [Streptomyces sp. ODS28]|uniref:hypothetical protein n=1 Tax=Streptomyces sp. ODS28 TaxID=3136688 RepID=UPI0031EBED22
MCQYAVYGVGVLATLGWLWAGWRLVTGDGGAVEAALLAGGWGLSVVPVHVTTASPRRRSDGGSGPW